MNKFVVEKRGTRYWVIFEINGTLSSKVVHECITKHAALKYISKLEASKG